MSGQLKTWHRWTPEFQAEFRRKYRGRIIRFYRSGIRSCTRIGYKLGFRGDTAHKFIGQILLEARLPIRRPWTNAEDKVLKRLYPSTTAQEIQKHLIRTRSQIYQRAHRLGVKPLTIRGGLTGETGKEFRFKKGQVPLNKGVKKWHKKFGLSKQSLQNMERTWFRRGHLPHNTKRDGAITVHTRWKCGAVRRKYIRLGLGSWIELKNHVWQKHHGNIPKGMCVAFRDLTILDKDGCPKSVIPNLMLVTRAQNAIHGAQQSDGYIASRMAMKGTKGVRGLKGLHVDYDLMRLILKNPALVNAKRRQLNLKRRIDEREALPANGRKQLPLQRGTA